MIIFMKKIFLIIQIFLIISCSIFQKPNEYNVNEIKNKILQNLSFLENCTATGIINFSYKNFEMKENFLFRKKDNKLRIDVFGAGLMGILPSQNAKILYVDSLQIFLPENKELYVFSENENFKLNFEFNKILTEISNFEKEKNEYSIETKSKMKFTFNKNFQLISIQQNSLKIEFSNFRNNLPYQIFIFYKNKRKAELEVDNWKFDEIKNEIFSFQLPNDVEIINKNDGIKQTNFFLKVE